MGPQRRSKVWIGSLAGLVVVLLLLVVSKTRRPQVEARTPADEDQTDDRAGSPRDWSPRAAVARDAPPGQADVDVGVVIDGVDVDKREVCRNEEVIVSIRAHATDRAPEYLNYGVMGKPQLSGSRFPLHLTESLGYGWMNVFARGKKGAATIAAVPPVVVKDCDAPVEVVVDVTRPSDMPDRVRLTARALATTPASPPERQAFRAVKYQWDFGDGTRATSTEPEIEHSYESRRQHRSYSYFFVTVDALDDQGRSGRGSQSVRFVNLAFRPLTMDDRVTVFAGARPNAAGGETLWLYHGHGSAVRLDSVVVNRVAADGVVRDSRGYEPAALFGFTELPAGASRVTRALDSLRPTDPNEVSVVEVSGKAADGKTATASFTLPAPPPSLAQTQKEAQP